MITVRNETIKQSADLPPTKRFGLKALYSHKTTVGVLALLLWAAQASAASFTFSTGEPDGKIATLSRAPGLDKIQTETADDLVVTQSIVISQATFTGLLPAGMPLTSVGNVEVEFYHVFPGDSNTNRIPNVPTRANSPGDVEIDDATRDGLDGSLAFAVTLVNSSFTASNSVVNGIIPGQGTTPFTGGEGAVTGQEVTIVVSFNPPIALPPGHYFFRPEVDSSGGDFLWLSAPRPIVAPGTPFLGDLQTWIRNDALAPDWLRIGTDITHQGPFNASFSLFGETDADGDGVGDSSDLCPGTPADTLVDADGCSIDQIAPCSGPATGGDWKNHGQYVSAVAHAAEEFVAEGLISPEQAEEIVEQAGEGKCGSKNSSLSARNKHSRRKN
jgi:hypothetical protein